MRATARACHDLCASARDFLNELYLGCLVCSHRPHFLWDRWRRQEVGKLVVLWTQTAWTGCFLFLLFSSFFSVCYFMSNELSLSIKCWPKVFIVTKKERSQSAEMLQFLVLFSIATSWIDTLISSLFDIEDLEIVCFEINKLSRDSMISLSLSEWFILSCLVRFGESNTFD